MKARAVADGAKENRCVLAALPRPSPASAATSGRGQRKTQGGDGRRIAVRIGQIRRTTVRSLACSLLLVTLPAQGWVDVTPAAGPAPRSRHAMCYDAARALVLLVGGRRGGGISIIPYQTELQRSDGGCP